MDTISNLTRDALLAIGEAVDLFVEATFDVDSGHGDEGDLAAYAARFHRLCAEHGVNPGEALDTFG
ncbi:hypothetical protein ACWFMI_25135 [Nocardiopsis terrae]|uniref:hypothetical protein n=1 Tax=Streptomyces sp. NPDC057554 TaxID=3350538 RepID=UPI0036A24622